MNNTLEHNNYNIAQDKEKIYTLTEKQLQDIVKNEVQLQRAIEQRDKAQQQYVKALTKDKYIFVESENKSIIGKIAKSIVNILEWKLELDKEKNIRKRMLAEFNKQMELDIARKRGLID